MACLGLRQVVFLGEKLMLLPALHLLWTWSEPHPSAKCRACCHWLKNTQINFLWGKKWDPLFSSLRSDDAIDFIVELEKRGSGGFMEPRERTLEKKVISYLPPHKSEEVSWPWLNPTLLSNSMTNFKNKVTAWKPATSVNISCLFHTKLLSHQNCGFFRFVPKALATLLQKSFEGLSITFRKFVNSSFWHGHNGLYSGPVHTMAASWTLAQLLPSSSERRFAGNWV